MSLPCETRRADALKIALDQGLSVQASNFCVAWTEHQIEAEIADVAQASATLPTHQ